MIQLRNKRVAVIGLRRPGLALMRFAKRQGAKLVKGFGMLPEQLPGAQQALKGMEIELTTTETLPANFANEFDCILDSYFIESYAPTISAAKAQGVEVYSDLDLASMCHSKLIAIAGSNGKSSTALTLKAIFDNQGIKSRILGGEFLAIGDSLLDSKSYSYHILIADAVKLKFSDKFRPHISVLLNIYPGESEKHQTFEDYGLALSRVCAQQEANDFLVHQGSADILYYVDKTGTKAKRLPFSLGPLGGEGAYFDSAGHKYLFHAKGAPPEEFQVNPRTRYYLSKSQNMLAAILVAKICDCSHGTIQNTIDELRPFPHRMECFKTLEGVKYYDDSKARNVAATLLALAGFSDKKRQIILIIGGEYQGFQFFKDLTALIKTRVKCLILTGVYRERFFKYWEGVTETYLVSSLEEAVQLAYQKAGKSDKVIFSPASRAERHLYVNSGQRGDQFKKLVNKLEEFSKARKVVVKKI
jgi:UDP-N-acetylmuramoylalanine--D-glutamate ligase